MAKWGSERAELISLASRLIHAGARLTTVRALTGISARESCSLYRELVGKGPATGCVPTSLMYYTSSPLIQFHSSAFYGRFVLARQANPEGTLADTILEAYRSYTEFAVKSYHDQGIIDIDRAFVLIQFVENEDLVFKKCRDCHAHFISPHALVDDCCPVCSTIKRVKCSCCDEKFTVFTMYPKNTVGRYTSLCPSCKSKGARPKRKSQSDVYGGPDIEFRGSGLSRKPLISGASDSSVDGA